MSNLLKKILEVLEQNGPLKAKKIALILDPTRTEVTHKDVSSVLHQELKLNLKGLHQDEQYAWEYKNPAITTISFDSTSNWLSASNIENSLRKYPNLLSLRNNVIFDFSNKSLFLDCILKILSLTNQLIKVGSRVTLKFDKDSDSISYLSRCGFFDKIHKDVIVLPYLPEVSLAKIYNTNSENLCEIISITKDNDDSYLLRLAELIEAKLSDEDKKILLSKLRTFIGELVGNVRDHGLSDIEGFIALQIYSSGKIIIAISDSGAGLINTLRHEALAYYQHNPDLIALKEQTLENDIELLSYVFNKGKVSRTGLERRGLGLSRTNEVLRKISNTRVSNISLTIRQQTNEFNFPLGIQGIETIGCSTKTDLMYIEGTHYVLTIKLDKHK